MSNDTEVAVVTGGASGFGLGLATECARRGMSVALLDRDAERVQAEADKLAGEHGVEALGLAMDVTVADDVTKGAAAVQERFGRADLVVSNVGVQLFGAIDRITDDEWRWVLDVNVVGSARTARAFVPLLRPSANPRLAFTTSSSILDPGARLGVYQASKFAVWGLAETIRLELKDEITVTVVFPSGMISRHLESSVEAQPEHLRRAIGEPEDFEAMMASNPGMSSSVLAPEEAAARSIEGILAGERYVITHGDLVSQVGSRDEALRRAAEAAKA